MRRLLPAALLMHFACTGLSGEYYRKGDVSYRVTGPHEGWRRVGFAENDLAWVSADGHVLAMNATCDDHGDPSLEVLTNHLLMGFTDRQLKAREVQEIDGREALESRYDAKLDGVEVELKLVVLKKDGCVHDFSYIAPKGQLSRYRDEFEALLDGFTTGRSAPPKRTVVRNEPVPEPANDAAQATP